MKTCIATYIFGKYTRYIAYYVYSILKSYPNYYVKLYVKDPLSKNELAALDLIRNQLSSNFEIIEGFFLPLSSIINEKKEMVGGIETTFRHLIPYNEVKEFDYLYIGDVDFLMIRESPDLVAVHLDHCRKTNLSYSNAIRPETKRLTGLYFIMVDEYYKHMDAIITSYLNHPEQLQLDAKGLKTDEEFLYQMIEKGIGFGELSNHHFRPTHGFHIGITRKGDTNEKIKKFNRYISQKQLQRHDITQQLITYYNDPLFQAIIRLSPDFGIEFIKQQLFTDKQH